MGVNGGGVHVRPAPAAFSNTIPFVVGRDSLTCRAVENVSGGGDVCGIKITTKKSGGDV